MNTESINDRPTGTTQPPPPKRKNYVVLAVSLKAKAAIIGTAYGQPFTQEHQANNLVRQLRTKHPEWSYFVVPISSRKEWGL